MAFSGGITLNDSWKRAFRFGTVGTSCFALSLGILTLGTSVWKWHYLVALSVALLVSNCLGFALNRLWTFEARGSFWPQLGRYYMVNAGTYALNFAMMTILVSVLHVALVTASILVAVLLAGVGFVLHGRWSFSALSPTTPHQSGTLN